MSVALVPSPAEYADMHWAARMAAAKRLRRLTHAMWTSPMSEAAAILAEMPIEPPMVTAKRRRDLEAALKGFTYDYGNGRH